MAPLPCGSRLAKLVAIEKLPLIATTSSPGVASALMWLSPIMGRALATKFRAPPTFEQGSYGVAKLQTLAVEVSTVIPRSPSGSIARSGAPGSGEAASQAGTSTPSLNTAMVCSFCPTGTIDESTRKTSTSGAPGVAAGAAMVTCSPRNWKPADEAMPADDCSIDTVPPSGVTTE